MYVEGGASLRGRVLPAACQSFGAMSGVWRLLRSAWLRASGPAKEYVGSDPFGNQYYRIPKHETWAGQMIKERRFVEAAGVKEYEYQTGDIPVEWEAWIRKKRNDPPTIEEILKAQKYQEEMKRRIEDVYEKERLLQAKEYKEGLVAEPLQTQIKGHASSPHFGKNEPSEEPVSTANIFQPGSWMPPKDSGRCMAMFQKHSFLTFRPHLWQASSEVVRLVML
uniref:NADH:ubiquinone oxidoreductase complex assembly factor 2 n=1 Tax=Anolis carolinensis TaxID=28377 RepID=G1KI90_ANOCA